MLHVICSSSSIHVWLPGTFSEKKRSESLHDIYQSWNQNSFEIVTVPCHSYCAQQLYCCMDVLKLNRSENPLRYFSELESNISIYTAIVFLLQKCIYTGPKFRSENLPEYLPMLEFKFLKSNCSMPQLLPFVFQKYMDARNVSKACYI